jgi:sulfur-oxidizing protein SoxY
MLGSRHPPPSDACHAGIAPGATRRAVVVGSAALLAMPLAAALTASAEEDQLAAAVRAITRGAAVKAGRVRLTLPELAENGNVVGLTVEAQSPMTPADHVRSIHIVSEKNPSANIVRLHFGPRSGRARASTNIRLADTQRVVALAEMSDGSFWSGEASVIVTLSACIDSG